MIVVSKERWTITVLVGFYYLFGAVQLGHTSYQWLRKTMLVDCRPFSCFQYLQQPSGYVKIAIENGPVEIVDLPINSMVIFHRFLLTFTRGTFRHNTESPCSNIHREAKSKHQAKDMDNVPAIARTPKREQLCSPNCLCSVDSTWVSFDEFLLPIVPWALKLRSRKQHFKIL